MNKLLTHAERLRYARGLLGLTRAALESDHDISHNTLSAWENGRLRLTNKGAEKLSKVFLGLGLICSPDWLLCESEDRPYLVHDLTSSAEVMLSTNICTLREIEAFKTINPKPIVMVVPDDGMLPVYQPGDFIAGNHREGEEIKKLAGTNCIVETKSGDIYFRRLLNGQGAGHFTLSCLNPSSNEELIITNIKLIKAAQVVWHRSSEKLVE